MRNARFAFPVGLLAASLLVPASALTGCDDGNTSGSGGHGGHGGGGHGGSGGVIAGTGGGSIPNPTTPCPP